MGFPECDQEIILLVEDNEDHAFLIRRGLGKGTPIESLQVVTSGEEAIEYLEGTGRYSNRSEFPLPAVLLLDLELPGISGFDVLRWIRNCPGLNTLKVVVITCSELEQDASLACILGANSFIVKPADLRSLIEMVETSRAYWLGSDKTPQAFRGHTIMEGGRKV
jgi:CheY-like chemotaxis protein